MGLAELTRARTAPEVLARMLNILSTKPEYAGHPLTNYNVGDPQRTLLEIPAEGLAELERLVSAIAAGGYLQTAAGEWLDEYVSSQYGLTRQDAVIAQGYLTFSALPGSGTFQLGAGTAWASTPDGSVRFVTLADATVPEGGSIQVLAQAQEPGSISNVALNSLTVLNTPQPGLSVTNGADWLVLSGSDVESDAALRQRARLRWAERGGGATRGAYEFWALSSTPTIDQVRVLDEHPRGQGTVDVVVWGSGGLGNASVLLADAYIQARRPVTADVHVYRATENTAIVPLTLYAPGADRTRIEGQVLANLAAVQKLTPIGGILYTSALIEAAMEPAGMIDAKLPETYHDIELGPTEALTLLPMLTWRDV